MNNRLFPRRSLRLIKAPSLIFLLLMSISSPALAQPSPPPAKTSLVNYQPQTTLYQSKLHPLVQTIQKSLKAQQAKDTELAGSLLASSEDLAKKLLQTLTRGYHDEVYFLLGFVYEKLGRPEEALLSYSRSLSLRANNPEALFRHAALLKAKNQPDKAIEELDEVLWRTQSGVHEVLHYKAECLLEKGETEKAVSNLELSLKAKANYLPALKLLIDIELPQLETTRDPKKHLALETKILAELKRLVHIHPADRKSKFLLAEMLIRKSDPLFDVNTLANGTALAKSLAQGSKYSDDEAVKLLFDAQVKGRKLEDAGATLTKGLEQLPNSELLRSAQLQLEIEKQASNQTKEEEEG